MNPVIRVKATIVPLLVAVVLACFGLLPTANGTPDPATVGGMFNTADGSLALASVTTGVGNSAFGEGALNHNTSGDRNTAVGANALVSNSGGSDNTAVGVNALLNSNANLNTAVGSFALAENQTGNFNTAMGVNALFTNTTGIQNTAVGVNALTNSNAANNAAFGVDALLSNTTGSDNTATGAHALFRNQTGSFNTAMGVNALLNNTGSSNVGLGTNAGYLLTTGSGNICIGVNVFGVKGESNTTRIRNVFSSVASGRAVFVNSDNKLGTLSSSRRFKEEIQPMDKVSETILALKPVTFRYKKEVDPARALSFGLIAEDVAKVDPDLITCDDEGKPETVRYEAVNAMLLNEFLKEHRKVEQLEKQVESLTAGLQKVSAQVELNKPAPQTVVSNQ